VEAVELVERGIANVGQFDIGLEGDRGRRYMIYEVLT